MGTNEIIRRRAALRSGGQSVDWESIARGMVDSTTQFSIPSELAPLLSTSQFMARTGLLSIEVPSGQTTINNSCFHTCTRLTQVTLPNTITTIGQRAFQYSGIIHLNFLPSSLVTIDSFGFYQCPSLEDATIPSSVTTIGAQCFRYCSNLKEVIMESSTPPALGSNTAFNNTHASLVIYVPDASVNDYKTANNWSDYATKIKGISERPT